MLVQARSQDLERGVHFRCQLTEVSVLVTHIFQLGSGGAVSPQGGPGRVFFFRGVLLVSYDLQLSHFVG